MLELRGRAARDPWRLANPMRLWGDNGVLPTEAEGIRTPDPLRAKRIV